MSLNHNGSSTSASEEAARRDPNLARIDVALRRDNMATVKNKKNIAIVQPNLKIDWRDGIYRPITLVKPVQPVKRLPPKYRIIEPIPALGDPVRAGDYWLWADAKTVYAFYSLAVPRLRFFSLTVKRESQQGTIEITGGNAVLEVSLSTAKDRQAVVEQYSIWTKQLAKSGKGKRKWQFQPITLSRLEASLQLNPTHISQQPQVTTNRDLATATFLIPLSATGVQIWSNALEQRRGNSIPGMLHLKPTFYARFHNHVGAKHQDLSVNLGSLLAPLGAEVIVNAQLELSAEAKFLVEWHPSLENVVVNWQANNGTPPGNRVFNQDSAPLSILLTANDLNTLEVNWNAKISFQDPQWPPIPETGKLSFANNDFTYILKPSAWVQDFTLIVSLLDAQGNLITSSDSTIDLVNRVFGMLNFVAPYLAKPLVEGFETSSQQIIKASFPVLPGTSPTLSLSILAQRGGKDGMLTRNLRLEENLVVVKVNTQAEVEITTNQDRVMESSFESEMLGVLAALE